MEPFVMSEGKELALSLKRVSGSVVTADALNNDPVYWEMDRQYWRFNETSIKNPRLMLTTLNSKQWAQHKV